MAETIEMSEALKSDLLDFAIIPKTIVFQSSTYHVDEIKAAGKKGVVWKVRDEIGRARALKLAICKDYDGRSYLEEFKNAALLEPYPDYFAQIYHAGPINLNIREKNESFICFVEQWVEGDTLTTFLETNLEHVSTTFLTAYVRNFSEILLALKTVGLRHDDLHGNNVMLVKHNDSNHNYKVKVVDTGSLKSIKQLSKKVKDDHLNFVDHIIAIRNAVHSRRPLSIHDRRFLEEVTKLINLMLDEDIGMALRDPIQIKRQFELAFTRARSPRKEQQETLSDPFEFIAAEHIADDRVLVDIFAKSCPWLSKVAKRDPCLVTGPRGCGKSTIFRWLSLKAHLHKPVIDIESIPVAGFYISCSSDLQNRLSWIKTDALAKRFHKEIVHYFNLLATREIVHTLELISMRDDREHYWGFGPAQEKSIHSFITGLLGAPRMHLQGVSRLAQCVEALESEMSETHSTILKGLNVGNPTASTMLGDLTSLLVKEVKYFKTTKITFLVDDFSIHRIPEPVQKRLNQVIWERRSSHIFKLSAEKYGAILVDQNEATADVAREMVEIDCGREFIALDDNNKKNQARAFAADLLNHRLKGARYKSTAIEIIGKSPRGSLAKALVDPKRGRIEAHYCGMDRLADLCSGDVSHLLLVFRKIFDAAGVDKDTVKQVSFPVQHRCVREVSGDLFNAIKAYYPKGPEMYGIVNSFGELVRKILERGRWIKKGKSAVPAECPRIEIDQTDGSVIDLPNDEQRELAKELIRRAIFIDMVPGLSRHDNVTTLRWHLRRIYLPVFHASLAKNDAIKEKPDWFKFFITNPTNACEMVWAKRPKQGENKDRRPHRDDGKQGKLI